MSSIEENVKAMIPQLTQEIAEGIKRQAAANLEYSVSTAIQAAVMEHLKAVTLPALKAELAEQELAIRAAILAATKGIAEQLSEALVQQMAKKLSGYDGEKLVRDTFGPFFRAY